MVNLENAGLEASNVINSMLMHALADYNHSCLLDDAQLNCLSFGTKYVFLTLKMADI